VCCSITVSFPLLACGQDALHRRCWSLSGVAVQCRYGRNYYTRYDYESVDSVKADKVMSLLESKMVRFVALPDRCGANIMYALIWSCGSHGWEANDAPCCMCPQAICHPWHDAEYVCCRAKRHNTET
jgi:hypothetical protein